MPITDKQLNKALQTQTDHMATKNSELTKSLGEVVASSQEHIIKTWKENTERTDAAMMGLVNKLIEFERKLISQGTLIAELQKEQSTQRETIKSLNFKLENAEIRARSKNIIIHGIKEDVNEAGPALKRKVCDSLNKHFGMASASIDLPYRLGASIKDKQKIRPVLVSFNYKSDRDKVLFRKSSNCPISVKADLPPETAAKRRILGQLTRWAQGENIKTKRTDHYVEMKGAKYNHIEAKEFLEACGETVITTSTDKKPTTTKNYPIRS